VSTPHFPTLNPLLAAFFLSCHTTATATHPNPFRFSPTDFCCWTAIARTAWCVEIRRRPLIDLMRAACWGKYFRFRRNPPWKLLPLPPSLSTFSTDCSVPPFVSYLQSLAPAKPQNVFQTTKEHLGMRYTRSGIWGWLCSGGLAFVRFSKGVNIDTSLLGGEEKFLGNFRFSTIRRDDSNQKIAWWWQQTLANWFGN